MDLDEFDKTPSGEIPVVPSTAHMAEELLQKADELDQRISDNPHIQSILAITNKLNQHSKFNTAYTTALTVMVIVLAVLGNNSVHNTSGLAKANTVGKTMLDYLRANCLKDNEDKKADFDNWLYISTQIAPSDAITTFLAQRAVIDTPTNCSILYP